MNRLRHQNYENENNETKEKVKKWPFAKKHLVVNQTALEIHHK